MLKICPVCKKVFLAKQSGDIYCGWSCYNKDRHPPKGENHPNWQGGISKNNDRRDSNDYKKWRYEVYKKDNFCCTKCGSKEKLNAHHIKSWHNYPELRYEVNNGITFCEKCHIEYHKLHGYDDASGQK